MCSSRRRLPHQEEALTPVMSVPRQEGTKIINEGKTTTTMRTITITMAAKVESSMMQTDDRSFNAEHVICGVILRRIVQQKTHQNYYVDGADLEIMKMPSA